MISLTVTATLCSPVHLGAKNTSANFLAGLGHIPGRALLGAAAWAWIDDGGDRRTPAFAQRFASSDVSWGDLLLVPEDDGALAEGIPIVPPRTAKTCKLFELRHGVMDDLNRPRALDEQGDQGPHCPECGAGLKRLDHALVLQTGKDPRAAKPSLQHRTHLSIGFDTGTARSGYLYSREVLEEGQVFRGQIQCADEPTADALITDLERLPLAVGGARSRGYGQLQVEVERGASPAVSMAEIARCSERLAAGRAPAPADVRYFTLTAASPWFLRESDGSQARVLSPSWLARALGIGEAAVRILDGEARSEARSGWDGAANLPTEVRHLIVAGSTFLCGVAGLDDAALHAGLTALLERGFGGHRLEGLGRVIVNHPLHFTSEAHRGS
jgi:hypothetical protein